MMTINGTSALWLLLAYLVGALPCGWLLARMKGIDDIRQHGSGNIGATNVARALGTKWFFITLLLDACKAYGVIWLMLSYGCSDRLIFDAAILLLFGNAYSIFLGFSGGKGVATSLGIITALAPVVALVTVLVWGILFAVVRTVGKASIAALVVLPVTFLLVDGTNSLYFALTCFMAFWTIIRHRDNLKQYMAPNA